MNDAAKNLLLSLLGEFEKEIDNSPNELSKLDMEIMERLLRIPSGYEDMFMEDL